MAYRLGTRSRVHDWWESSHLEVRYGYRRADHPELFDLELEAAAFEDKWIQWERAKHELFDELRAHINDPDDEAAYTDVLERMDEEARADWLHRWEALKSGLSSADVAPVLDFVDAHIIRVEGIEDREGNPVDEWQPLEAGDRREVLRMMPPHELANLYAAIKQSASLSVDRKND